MNNRCALTDPWADTDRPAAAAESVDGVADISDAALHGNFNQLLKLKQQYPRLKVLISLGGWTLSAGFSNAALPENRKAFVTSCVDLFIKDFGGLASSTGSILTGSTPACAGTPAALISPAPQIPRTSPCCSRSSASNWTMSISICC